MNVTVPTNAALTDAVEYFAGLPRFTLSAVQAAWDRAQSTRFTVRGSFGSLCKDFNHVGFKTPSLEVFEVWAEGAKKGEVPRPLSPVSTLGQKSKLYAAVQDFSAGEQTAPPLNPTSDVATADASIEMYATRLFEDTVASLEREARATAAGIVAKRLREVADRIAALAA